MARKLTAADVRDVSGYDRNAFRAVLDGLPQYKDSGAQARVAREFTRHDLIVFSVMNVLETRHGLRRSVVVGLFVPLRAALSGPKRVNRQARLLISVQPQAISYIEDITKIECGILVPLQAVFDRVDGYLGMHSDGTTGIQSNLKLGPTVMSSRKNQRT